MRCFRQRAVRPLILAGDLNSRRGRPPMDELLRERWTAAPTTEAPIDYVLVRREDPWRVVESHVIDERVASDHRPVLVVLEWTAPDRRMSFDLRICPRRFLDQPFSRASFS